MIEAVIIGIVAWVFCLILIDEGMIFGYWWTVLNKLPVWLSKPLGACEYCFAGQLALWWYIYQSCLTGQYNAFYHIAFISVAIFTVKVINELFDFLENSFDN
jgi:hypothetical protein